MTLPGNTNVPERIDLADALVARGELDRAEEVLRDGLAACPDSLELREALASLLIQGGRVAEGAALLDDVATACARAGLPGRAIAALKKLARVDPAALTDAGRRIAALARQRDRGTPQAPLPHGEGRADARPGEPAAERVTSSPVGRSPLFDDFSADELAAVIQGLDLLTFAPGDLVVSQGESGRSLFVVVSGTLKVWVRGPEGRGRFVRRLGDGDFFGEVSLLTGRARTATVTAATKAELLELDWSRVEEIVRDHPRVSDVLRAFCDERLKADAASRVSGEPGRASRP